MLGAQRDRDCAAAVIAAEPDGVERRRLSTGYGDEAIKAMWHAHVALD
jgi:hypothetical protein